MACRHRGLVLLEWGLKDYLDRGELTEITVDRPVSVSRGEEMGSICCTCRRATACPRFVWRWTFLVKQLQTS
jgi:hypothetical protein